MTVSIRAAREGSDLTPNYEDVPLHLMRDELAPYPLLRVVVAETREATNPKIEWIVDNDGSREVWENYCQIVRTPFKDDDSTAKGLALASHLGAIENTLWDGIPSFNLDLPIRFCGGVRHFLGRDPLVGDTIIYRPLRSTCLLKNRGLEGNVHEYLTEFSLQVVPAARLCKRS